ncbi:signal peptidase I [Enterococcus sp. MJM16]|uniref:Signal peptidase I n=1 Tax=Candidatus Enterococcus murrayae TaxID=2815321 RepID=A0ABS3HD82_9ENTE|nr:signal peptidase I [Enterococcus sp. MJM16]MBO0450992.1 signal peptidase I [Enterococcus sp. MJM16]
MRNKKITILYAFLIFALFLLAIFTIVIPKLLDVTPYVISDSKMAPEYNKGGLVFVKDVREPIHVGDTITYYENQGKAIKTRRVLAVDHNIDGYFVKGDNSDKAEMGLVHERNLIGRPHFYLPYIGFLADTKVMSILKISLFIGAILMTLSTLLFQTEGKHKLRQQVD